MWRLLLISFALVTGSFVIDQTIRWSDPLDGLLSGLIQVFVVGINWCVLILPWSLAVWGLYHWCKWHRFRTHWVLAPAVAQVLSIVVWLFLYPPTAHGSYKRFVGVEMPVDAKSVKYHLWGGGFADYSITYYFECSSESLDKLTTDMELETGAVLTAEGVQYLPPIKRLPDCPDPKQWVGGRTYSKESGSWDFTIITDPTKTKVYVWMWCI